MSSEDESWPARRVSLGDGEAVFESSWKDHNHISRIGVTASSVTTATGIHAGMRLDSLLGAGAPAQFKVEEGVLVVNLEHGTVGALLDAASQTAFARQSNPMTAATAGDVPVGSRIAELVVAESCGQP
jgi:hypothetical protein